MGLRAKVLIATVVLLTLLAAASTVFLRVRADEAIRVKEASDAARDMRLLLTVLNTQLVQIDGVLRSWSNWTQFYEHADHPSAAFRAVELAVPSLAVGQVDWLGLIDAGGHLSEQIIVPPEAGAGLLVSPDNTGDFGEKARKLAARSATRERACGIVTLEGHLSFACYRPLLDSQGNGPPRGTVVLGRRITTQMLAEVAQQNRLQFRVLSRATAQAMEAPRDGIETPFGRAALSIQSADEQNMMISVPLLDLGQQHLADLQLTWPRAALAAARGDLAQTTWLLLLLVAGTGLATIVVVDLLVVRRLGRLKDELAAIVATGRWDGGIQSSGRDEIAALAAFINDIIGVVRRQMDDLAQLALTDTLTGLSNRRGFDDRLGKAAARFERTSQPSALILFDVDCFKSYNDLYGHPAGDEALRLVARVLRDEARRPGDLAARVGGEEFALLLEDTELEAALARAEVVRQAVMGAMLPHTGNTAAQVLTLSGGVAALHRADTAIALYVRADSALYAAKQAGRNRVVREPATAG